MDYKFYDYDRSDFFQIHTYINYYDKNFNVIAGGLIYPLSNKLTDEKEVKNSSSSLFGENKDNIQYFIDGIDLSDLNSTNIIIEEKFIYFYAIFLI